MVELTDGMGGFLGKVVFLSVHGATCLMWMADWRSLDTGRSLVSANELTTDDNDWRLTITITITIDN